jgi:alanine-glyoxylate transaminase/serine-glyoxylate transaminase/serine-pyruvate transaminase
MAGVKASLNNGRDMVAIPGPSVTPDRVLAAMHRPMPNIYAGELLDITDEIFEQLPGIARTSATPFVTVSNGHGAWEMSISNTLSRGDRVLVLESGRFAVVWGEMAAVSGVEIETIHAADRAPIDPDDVEQRLLADTDRTIKAVFAVHVDTSTSVRNDIAAIRRAIDAADHPALLMVDCIASLGCDRYLMDEWGVDVTVGASQKGLMVPPGLGFVWVGPKAWAAHAHAGLRSGYWDWTHRSQDGPHYLRYCGTPPVPHMYGLREALAMIREETLDCVWDRHATLARAVHAAVDAWAAPDGLELHIVDPAARSNAVTTIRTGGIDGVRLRELCEERAGLTLGIGLAPYEHMSFRIGHMGHVNPPMLLGTLGTIEAGLSAMDAPTGASGVAAAATVVATAMR